MKLDQICMHQTFMVSKTDSVARVVQLMQTLKVGSIVVVEDEQSNRKPVGIITDRDIAITLMQQVQSNLFNLPATKIMSDDLLLLNHQHSPKEALAAMQHKLVRRAPVVDDAGNACGMVTVDDLLCLFVDELNDLANIIRCQIGLNVKLNKSY